MKPTQTVTPLETTEDLAKRIGPAGRSPRAHEAFPYRPRPGHSKEDRKMIRAEAEEVLHGINDMIHYLLQRQVTQDKADYWDIYQDVCWYLIDHSLPRYQPSRGTKLSTFMYKCCQNAVFQEVVSTFQLRRKTPKPTHEPFADRFHGKSYDGLDRRIELIASEVHQHPEKYFTTSQANVLRAMLAAGPEVQMKDLGKCLGYENASSLSQMLKRMTDKILEIDFSAWVPNEGVEDGTCC